MKEKRQTDTRAADLYMSALFTGRRRFVEQSCDAWWILSAKHGLVDPDRVLAPYDEALKNASRPERRRWASAVLQALDDACAPTDKDVIEIHAGAEYRDFGLVEGLEQRGCVVENPTEGMRIGRQLQFYEEHAGR